MAISMSGATIETGERDGLKGSSIDTSVTSGGATANTKTTGMLWWKDTTATGATLAGVTPAFATNVCKAIDDYKTNVQTYIDKLEDKNSEQAFKGEQVKAALTNFITEIKTVANSYLDKLSAAEQEIINSVGKAYETQDTDLSGDMGADTTTLDGQKAQ